MFWAYKIAEIDICMKKIAWLDVNTEHMPLYNIYESKVF